MFSKITDILIYQIESGNLQWVKKLENAKRRFALTAISLIVFFSLHMTFDDSSCIHGIANFLLGCVVLTLFLVNFADNKIRTNPFRYGLYIALTLLGVFMIGTLIHVLRTCLSA